MWGEGVTSMLEWEWVTLGSAEDEWDEVGDEVIFDAVGKGVGCAGIWRGGIKGAGWAA